MFPKNGSAISSRSRVPSDSIMNTRACGSHRTHMAKRSRLSERPRRLCTYSLEIVRRLYAAKEACESLARRLLCFPLEEHLLTNLLRHPGVEAVPSQFVDVLPIPDKGFA